MMDIYLQTEKKSDFKYMISNQIVYNVNIKKVINGLKHNFFHNANSYEYKNKHIWFF